MLLAPIANMARVVERVHDHVAILHQGTLLWCAFLHIKPRMASAKGGYHIQSPADFELCGLTRSGPVCAPRFVSRAGPVCAPQFVRRAGPVCAPRFVSRAGPVCAPQFVRRAGPVCAPRLVRRAGPVHPTIREAGWPGAPHDS
jgi:hypothetical protein